MATEESDPAADPRADYDYAGGAVPDEHTDLVAGLRDQVAGSVRFDEFTRSLYATDASAYEVTPVGVVMPRDTEDVAATVAFCAERGVPVLPRGGGTSLAGQSVNEAVVLDFTAEMDAVVEVDPEAETATAQPGCLLGDLNTELADHDLKFAPDPAWGDKSAIGGAVGNNSTGAHSLQYGKTDAYVESCEVVFADGSTATLGETTVGDLRRQAETDGSAHARVAGEALDLLENEAGAIESAYPDLKRNVSGYNLNAFVADAYAGLDREPGDREGPLPDDATVNLATLLCGSEGTLAVVTEVTVSLEPVPETKAVALLGYDDLVGAMEDVTPILEHDPAAVEVLDDVLLDLARDTTEFGDLVRELAPQGTGAVLLVEFYADDDAEGRAKVADLFADRARHLDADAEADPTEASGAASGATPAIDAPTRATFAREAHDDEDRARFWKLRKSGLPILLGRTSDAKHISFVEDCAVPPERLPEYVTDFREVLEEHETYASFYAHAGPGCLHVRPLVNTKTVEGVDRMQSIADDVTDLVVEYGGSVSGEHGDGRARSGWNRKLYGDHVFGLFRDLKSAFDPESLLNPGQVCGDVDMTENLRFDPDYEFDADRLGRAAGSGAASDGDGATGDGPGFEPTLSWDNENGFQGMVELCHGCGGCRGPQETTGGVMCPTYRAADEEIQSTRGRANSLRRLLAGELDPEAADHEFLSEVMDLCVGCKGCARDCPSQVDMAKLKAEVEHAAHEAGGSPPLRDRVFANVFGLSAGGSRLAPLVNALGSLPGSNWLAEKTLGIARERDLPRFASESFVDWFETHDPAVAADEAAHRVVLLPDPYSTYVTPEVARAAVTVLEAAGVHVDVAEPLPSGRAAHSKGFLDTARERADEVVSELAPHVENGWDVVVVEPTDAVMVQSDYGDLLSGPAVETVREHTHGVCEYLDRHDLDRGVSFDAARAEGAEGEGRGHLPVGGSLAYHGHCHQKATKKDHHAVGVLRRAGFAVDPLDSTCCGMAGSFGYEAEHYSMSRAVGEILFEQVEESPAETVVAPGASCRTQLDDWEGLAERPPHPVEVLSAALER
ncbi:MAG: FAD-linked oxidase C-terminal domain-containing protein [Haloglomus sp.]